MQTNMPGSRAELYRRWMRMADTTGFKFDANQSASDLNNNKKATEATGSSSSGAAEASENNDSVVAIKTEEEEECSSLDCIEVDADEKKPPYRSFCRYVHLTKMDAVKEEEEASSLNTSPREQQQSEEEEDVSMS